MKINPFLQWWMTPRLPAHYVYLTSKPLELDKQLRLYIRHYFFHPVKRRIAKYYLWVLQTFFGLIVVGITGSSGKTTTKDLLASIYSTQGSVVKSFANIDPVFNIPTTILKCTPLTKYLVLEMGVEQPNEMPFYLWVARPHVGIITNVYQTHTQFFGSVQGVTEEKGGLVKPLGNNDWAVLNKENPETLKLGKRTRANVIWFGKNADVYATDVEFQNGSTNFVLHIKDQQIEINLPILGEQFVANALAAAACASVTEINIEDIKKGLESSVSPEHRMTPIKLKNGAIVIDDSYNNNPTAAKNALETLKAISGRKKAIAVIGDMLELGSTERKRHQELGSLISELKIDYFIGVGPLSKDAVSQARKKLKDNSIWVATNSEVLEVLKPHLKRDTVTLIKGSRSIGLDKVIDQIKKSLV